MCRSEANLYFNFEGILGKKVYESLKSYTHSKYFKGIKRTCLNFLTIVKIQNESYPNFPYSCFGSLKNIFSPLVWNRNSDLLQSKRKYVASRVPCPMGTNTFPHSNSALSSSSDGPECTVLYMNIRPNLTPSTFTASYFTLFNASCPPIPPAQLRFNDRTAWVAVWPQGKCEWRSRGCYCVRAKVPSTLRPHSL